jgi:hypothetical protein
MVAVVLVVAAGVWVYLPAGAVPSDPSRAAISVQSERVGDGVARNDAVVLVHEGGDALERGNLRVEIGPDTVFNTSLVGDTGGSGTVTTRLEGLIVEVDDGPFNDLNKPGSGPPGDADGDSANVVNEWNATVEAGDRLVIQERNDPRSYDVIQAGEPVRVIWIDDDGETFVLAETTVDG